MLNEKLLEDHALNKPLYWKAYTGMERHVVIERASSTIGRYGAIISHTTFSDIDLFLMLEVEGNNISNLYTALSEFMTLEKEELLGFNPNKDITIFLNITFSRSTGNLTTIVPAVPG